MKKKYNTQFNIHNTDFFHILYTWYHIIACTIPIYCLMIICTLSKLSVLVESDVLLPNYVIEKNYVHGHNRGWWAYNIQYEMFEKMVSYTHNVRNGRLLDSSGQVSGYSCGTRMLLGGGWLNNFIDENRLVCRQLGWGGSQPPVGSCRMGAGSHWVVVTADHAVHGYRLPQTLSRIWITDSLEPHIGRQMFWTAGAQNGQAGFRDGLAV